MRLAKRVSSSLFVACAIAYYSVADGFVTRVPVPRSPRRIISRTDLSFFREQSIQWGTRRNVLLKETREDSDHGRPSPYQTNIPPPQTSIPSFFIGFCLSLMVLLSPLQQAHAAFGPPSAATSQPVPGLIRPAIQDKDIGGKKLKQLIGSTLDESRLEQFSTQLDDVIESLKQRKETASEQGFTYSSQDEEELQNAVLLQEQISSRERLLEKLEAQPYWFNYLAAFIGSVASTLVMHPVDTIKTRLQVEKGSTGMDDDEEEEELLVDTSKMKHPRPLSDSPDDTSGLSTLSTISSDRTLRRSPSTHNTSVLQQEDGPVTLLTREKVESDEEEGIYHLPSHYKTEKGPLLSPTTTIIQKETPKEQDENFLSMLGGLYVGLTGNLLKEGPPSALYLGVYESVKYSLLPRSSPEYLLLVYLAAGAAGEMVGSCVRAPAEAVKSLVQSESADSALQAAEQILGRPEGRANVLRAWSTSIWRDVPFGAIQLAIFELIKAYILNNPNIDFDSSTLSSEAIIGAFAGGCGAFLTNPADVITTRIITQNTNEEEGDKPLGFVAMGRQIYDEGGLGAFFTGWKARVLYWAPAISLFLTCYCSVRQAGVRYDIFG